MTTIAILVYSDQGSVGCENCSKRINPGEKMVVLHLGYFSHTNCWVNQTKSRMKETHESIKKDEKLLREAMSKVPEMALDRI